MRELLLPILKRHEGLRLSTYRCTEGVLTIGYGHTGPEVKEGLTITEKEAEELLLADIDTAEKDAKLFPYYHNLSPARQAVVVNMIFNLGVNRFSKFLRFNAAMIDKDYVSASVEMLKSRWSTQVGVRSFELARIMSSGKIEKVAPAV